MNRLIRHFSRFSLACQSNYAPHIHPSVHGPSHVHAHASTHSPSPHPCPCPYAHPIPLCLQGGESSIRESSLVFKELNERFGTSSAGLNGLASACIAARRYEEADRYLADAAERNGDDPETLINQIQVASQTGRSGRAEELTARLKSVAPRHPYVESLAIAEGMFDRLAGQYASAASAAGGAAAGGSGDF